MTERLNLADDLRFSGLRHPDKAALIFERRLLDYGELDSLADRVALGLHRLGIIKGDRVAAAVGNHPEFAALYYGTLRAGAVSVPLRTSLRAADLRAALTATSPRAIVADEAVANEVMSAGPHAAPVFVIGEHPTARPFGEILVEGSPPDVETTAADLAVVAFTSGTGGSPKGAMLTHGNLAANLEQMMQLPQARTEPDDVVLGVLPLYHVYGLNVVLGLSVRQGATVALEERFDPAGTMESAAANGVTILVGTPHMYRAWLAMGARRHDLSKVRFAVSGASALPAQLIADFRGAFGVEIWEGYGLTEASPTVATTRMGEQRPGSIGKVLPGQEIRLVDPLGDEVALGDPGEIWLRGPNVFRAYWEEDEATRAAFAGEWFRTGDVAYRDEEGYLWFAGRTQEVITVSGFHVYPREVEEAIASHPAVAEVAVVGEVDPRQGQRVKAFVVLRAGRSAGEEDIVVHCARRLARFKVPAGVDFVKELPVSDSGRVLKRLLPAEGRGRDRR